MPVSKAPFLSQTEQCFFGTVKKRILVRILTAIKIITIVLLIVIILDIIRKTFLLYFSCLLDHENVINEAVYYASIEVRAFQLIK